MITLADYCYSDMFRICIKLKEIKVHFTAYNKDALTWWMDSVSSIGTFYKPLVLSTMFGDSGIPIGWTIVNYWLK